MCSCTMQAVARPYSSGELGTWRRPALQPQEPPDPAKPSAPRTASPVGPRRPVPNHLLQTRTFRSIVKNQVVEAKPGILHFGGYELGKQHAQDMKLINISAECINMHIIPPQTKYFQVKHSKKGALVPGLSLRVRVEFCPDEWRYYYDCIRVHCQGDETLLVPIHGYPVVNVPDLPSFINIPDTAVGQSREVAIPLRCSCPIDFEFQVSIAQPNPVFTVTPSAGLIPAHGETRLVVRFSPREFSTARAALSLLVSQFNAKSLECTVTGTSLPGTHARRARAVAEERSSKAVPSPTASQAPEPRRPHRRAQLPSHPRGSASGVGAGGASAAALPRLDTVFAVSRILCEQPDRPHARELRDALRGGGTGGGGGALGSRHAAEARFMQRVATFDREERANALRWQVHLGSDPLSSREKWEIVEAQRVAMLEYQRSRGEDVGALAQADVDTVLTSRRSCRDISQELPVPPSMDVLVNDPWLLRQRALRRLQQAARKVIVRGRLKTRLARLKALAAQEYRVQPHTGHVATEREASWSGDESEEEEEGGGEGLLKISAERILPVSFRRVAVDRLSGDNNSSPVQLPLMEPTLVHVSVEVPYRPLKVVPQAQQLGRYQAVSVCNAFLTYSPAALPAVGPHSPPARPQEEQQWQSGPGKSGQVEEEARESDRDPDGGGPKPMSPPAALLLGTPQPSPLLLNAGPGLRARVSTLPLADVQLECGLPSGGVTWGPAGRRPWTQRRALMSRDAARGAMEWQRFPPAGLRFFASSSQANPATPGWSALAGGTALPDEAPPLQRALAPEDGVGGDGAGGGPPAIALTPSMVAATFVIPDGGAAPRA